MDKISGGFGASWDLPTATSDTTNRLSYFYSSWMCITFAIIISTTVLVGERINCWVPAHFTDNQQAYTDDFCWVQNTYYHPFSKEIPKEDQEDERQVIPYYQWIAFILLVQALFFYLPEVVWKTFSRRCGISIADFISSVGEMPDFDTQRNDAEKKEREMTNKVVNVKESVVKLKRTIKAIEEMQQEGSDKKPRDEITYDANLVWGNEPPLSPELEEEIGKIDEMVNEFLSTDKRDEIKRKFADAIREAERPEKIEGILEWLVRQKRDEAEKQLREHIQMVKTAKDELVSARKSLSNIRKEYLTVAFLSYLHGSAERAGRSHSCTASPKSLCSRTLCRPCSREKGNYLVMLFLVVKLLYILNAVGQLLLLNVFLGQNFSMYGIDFIKHGLNGGDPYWLESERFPRVTMCDILIRRLGNVNRYTVQCVLPINLFNEKIYLFLWFWLVFLVFALVISMFRWSVRSVFRVDRLTYIKKHLRLMADIESKTGSSIQASPTKIAVQRLENTHSAYPNVPSAPTSFKYKDGKMQFGTAGQDIEEDGNKYELSPRDREQQTKSFVYDFLKNDGVFIMRLLAENTGAIKVTEYIWTLYRYYVEETAE